MSPVERKCRLEGGDGRSGARARHAFPLHCRGLRGHVCVWGPKRSCLSFCSGYYIEQITLSAHRQTGSSLSREKHRPSLGNVEWNAPTDIDPAIGASVMISCFFAFLHAWFFGTKKHDFQTFQVILEGNLCCALFSVQLLLYTLHGPYACFESLVTKVLSNNVSVMNL